MKKITLSIFLMLTGFAFAQTSPINFEAGGNGASWTWNTFENPSTPCPPLLIIPNPDPTGANTSATVASYTPVVGAPFYAGTESAHGSPLGTFTLSASNSTVKIMVWKPVISNVGIKFATASGDSTGEINVANTVVNQWEELTFNFAGKIGEPSSTNIDQIIVFIDSQNNRSSDNTCYFDNITFSDQVVTPTGPTLPLDFESASLTYNFTSFGGAQTDKISNPDASGINPSANVARLTKNAGSEVWAGSYIELATPVNFSNSQTIKVKTWSPTAGITVRMKLENLATPATFVEVDATTTVANTWEELTFEFPGVVNANNYQRLVMFFNFGQSGTGENYYFDDVATVISAVETVALPIDFESATLAYNFTNFGGAQTDKIPNPDATGLNTSGNVARLLKTAGSEVWAGSFIELGNPIDFSTVQSMKIKTWSPQAGIVVKLKLENLATPAINIEVDVPTTIANAWEELTFNFPGIVNANNYQRVVVFFNFGTAGTGENYYFDDVKLGNSLATADFTAKQLSVYPNPTTNMIYVNANGTMATVSVLNVLGQEMLSQDINAQSAVLDLSNLQTGMYILKTSIAGKITTVRIIKE